MVTEKIPLISTSFCISNMPPHTHTHIYSHSYIYIYVYIYIYIYACVCVCVCVYIYTLILIYILFSSSHLCTFIHSYTFVCLHGCMRAHTRTHTHTHTHRVIYIHIYTHTYTHTHIYALYISNLRKSIQALIHTCKNTSHQWWWGLVGDEGQRNNQSFCTSKNSKMG